MLVLTWISFENNNLGFSRAFKYSKTLNSGDLGILKNVCVIERCLLLG